MIKERPVEIGINNWEASRDHSAKTIISCDMAGDYSEHPLVCLAAPGRKNHVLHHCKCEADETWNDRYSIYQVRTTRLELNDLI